MSVYVERRKGREEEIEGGRERRKGREEGGRERRKGREEGEGGIKGEEEECGGRENRTEASTLLRSHKHTLV